MRSVSASGMGRTCLQQCTEYTDEETCNAQGRCNWYGWVCVQPCTELPDEETCNAQDDLGVRKCNWDGSACLQQAYCHKYAYSIVQRPE